ncbi:MAG: pseudouridine-5'-phosphate glycosidase [Eubacteriaceae bacterium]|nr:pseudouridine-5'-phosphate glycosidase [Eubacteriaceae bacterium]
MEHLFISEEVSEALANSRGVVALESTIISHGMPYPQNVQTALKVEAEIRNCGAVPATIAVIKGKIKVGLTEEEIEYLGHEGPAALKCSRRDLAYAVFSGLNGALTVAGTMICAQAAGIRIFATGGIGGVHRGGEKTMDISADLEELGRTQVAVVCAGCKSILDIGLTLEYLETKGVAVIGYQTDVMPAFYTAKSPFKTTFTMNSPEQLAGYLNTKREMKLGGGDVIVNPVPQEYSMEESVINEAISAALSRCEQRGIKGKQITPFLLEEIKNITGGDSLEANIALVLNNARLAAQTAKLLK